MIEEFKSEGWRDFSQRYKDTYGWYLTDTGRKVLVQLVDVNDTTLKFAGKEGQTYTAIADKGNCFEFLPLERAVHNTPTHVYYCSRVPARQWRRGVHQANTSITNLLGGGWAGGEKLSFDLLEQIFQENNPTDYIQSFLSGDRVGLALNSMFAMGKNRVYLYNRVIGEYKNRSITLSNHLFSQEINDLVRDLALPYKVELK